MSSRNASLQAAQAVRSAFDGGLGSTPAAPRGGSPDSFPGFLPPTLVQPQAKKGEEEGEEDPPAGGKGKAGEEDEEEEEAGGDKGEGGKKGQKKPKGEEEEEGDGEQMSRRDHEAAMARLRASGARRLRRMRSEFEQRMDELESRLGTKGGEGEGEEEEHEEPPKGKAGAKGKAPEGSPVLRRQLEQERQKRRDLESRLRLDGALSEVRTAARKAGAHAEDVVDILRGRLSFESEEPDAAAFVKMQVDGEAEDLSIEEAVGELLKQRPHLKRAAKRPQGSGSRGARGGAPGGSGGSPEKPKTFEDAEKATAERLRGLLGQ
ncbi:MAG: hypothetical protein IPK67_18740 [Planctomycetes bacterium]|nr:hypothetical protein [Planctomycetota bacterium]